MSDPNSKFKIEPELQDGTMGAVIIVLFMASLTGGEFSPNRKDVLLMMYGAFKRGLEPAIDALNALERLFLEAKAKSQDERLEVIALIAKGLPAQSKLTVMEVAAGMLLCDKKFTDASRNFLNRLEEVIELPLEVQQKWRSLFQEMLESLTSGGVSHNLGNQ